MTGRDDELLAAIARGAAIYAKAKDAEAEGWTSYRAWILEHCNEVVPLDDFIFSTHPTTREGVMAKAGYALKNYCEPQPGGGMGLYHHPYSALLDLYRLAGGVA